LLDELLSVLPTRERVWRERVWVAEEEEEEEEGEEEEGFIRQEEEEEEEEEQQQQQQQQEEEEEEGLFIANAVEPARDEAPSMSELLQLDDGDGGSSDDEWLPDMVASYSRVRESIVQAVSWAENPP